MEAQVASCNKGLVPGLIPWKKLSFLWSHSKSIIKYINLLFCDFIHPYPLCLCSSISAPFYFVLVLVFTKNVKALTLSERLFLFLFFPVLNPTWRINLSLCHNANQHFSQQCVLNNPSASHCLLSYIKVLFLRVTVFHPCLHWVILS